MLYFAHDGFLQFSVNWHVLDISMQAAQLHYIDDTESCESGWYAVIWNYESKIQLLMGKQN